jgi:hypothetical protein
LPAEPLGLRKHPLFLVKPRYKAAVILKTFELFIDEELQYIAKSLCGNILKMVTTYPRF